MNYSLYLQSGGSMQAPTSDEQALAHQKQVDNQMAEAIKQNPASLDQAIQDYGEEAPAFIKHMIDVAAENQDGELLEILKPYAEKFNIMSFRCGGKVRAKIKKACSGKKMEKGGEAPIKKEAKGGKPCPCTLHKVGGKLIEVDCNGIPVAKNGAVLYAKPGAEIPRYWESQPDNLTNAIVDNIKGNNTGNYYIYSDGSVDAPQRFYTEGKTYPNYIYPVGKRYTVPASLYYTGDPVGTELNDILFKSSLANDPGKRNAVLMAHGYKPIPLMSQEEVESRLRDMQVKSALDPLSPDYLKTQQTINKLPSQATINWRNNFGEGKQGKFGGLTYNEALARQKEMQAAKAQGFNVDLGRWGADGKWGNQSQKEWERYQLWKTRQTPEFKFVKEGYDKGGWSDDELKNMEQEYAKFLDPTDRQRWQTLNESAINALPAENRKDIYNITTARAPFAQINPIVAARKDGGKLNYANYLK